MKTIIKYNAFGKEVNKEEFINRLNKTGFKLEEYGIKIPYQDISYQYVKNCKMIDGRWNDTHILSYN